MITPFVFAFIGYTLLAIVAILDKFILTSSVRKPAVYTFYSTIFFFAVVLLLPYCMVLSGTDILWAMLSGLAFGFGLWSMYVALEYGEASHIFPFIGASTAIASYILSSFFLHEVFNSTERVGLLLLILSSLLLSYEKTRKHSGLHRGFLWAIVSGALLALSYVTAKHIYDFYPFITGLVWTKVSVGFVGLVTLALPSVRSHVNNHKIQRSGSMGIVLTDKILGMAGVIIIQYAVAIGRVTTVNALAGIQYILTVTFVYLLTLLRPKVFSEYFTRKEILIQIAAVLLIVLGLMFLQ